jgi:hypothetical protein
LSGHAKETTHLTGEAGQRRVPGSGPHDCFRGCVRRRIESLALREATRQGIARVHGFFVVGSPDETEADILDSFRFAARLELDTNGRRTRISTFGASAEKTS